jgi:hypothetical protein
MYLRQSRQACGQSKRIYVSIAHNIWSKNSTSEPRRPGARPFLLLQLGESSSIDSHKAQTLVQILRTMFPAPPRGEALEWVERTSEAIRPHSHFFRRLVAPGPDDLRAESEGALLDLMANEIARKFENFESCTEEFSTYVNPGFTPGTSESLTTVD